MSTTAAKRKEQLQEFKAKQQAWFGDLQSWKKTKSLLFNNLYLVFADIFLVVLIVLSTINQTDLNQNLSPSQPPNVRSDAISFLILLVLLVCLTLYKLFLHIILTKLVIKQKSFFTKQIMLVNFFSYLLWVLLPITNIVFAIKNHTRQINQQTQKNQTTETNKQDVS